jgi:hypothetical protein
MSTSSSLSSAKRRRAGGSDLSNSISSNVVSSQSTDHMDDGKRIMSVQDVLYMLNSKIEHLSTKLEQRDPVTSTSTSNNDELITQITDSIDNMNSTLEQFSEILGNYEERIQSIESSAKASVLEEKIHKLETRINEKILSKSSEKMELLTKKKGNSTKEMLAEKVPDKKSNTVEDKFAESQKKKDALKQFEKQSAKLEEDNMKISFTGLKDKIETNKEK